MDVKRDQIKWMPFLDHMDHKNIHGSKKWDQETTTTATTTTMTTKQNCMQMGGKGNDQYRFEPCTKTNKQMIFTKKRQEKRRRRRLKVNKTKSNVKHKSVDQSKDNVRLITRIVRKKEIKVEHLK